MSQNKKNDHENEDDEFKDMSNWTILLWAILFIAGALFLSYIFEGGNNCDCCYCNRVEYVEEYVEEPVKPDIFSTQHVNSNYIERTYQYPISHEGYGSSYARRSLFNIHVIPSFDYPIYSSYGWRFGNSGIDRSRRVYNKTTNHYHTPKKKKNKRPNKKHSKRNPHTNNRISQRALSKNKSTAKVSAKSQSRSRVGGRGKASSRSSRSRGGSKSSSRSSSRSVSRGRSR